MWNGSEGPSSAAQDMGISAKADYAVRAAVEMAAAGDEPVKGEAMAEAQDIPLQFLEHILLELKHARLVRARRGARGGYWLAKPPEEITLANVIRAVEGPLANIQDQAPEQTKYPGNAEQLSEVWIAVRASLRRVLEHVTIADLRDGKIPDEVLELTRDDGAAPDPDLRDQAHHRDRHRHLLRGDHQDRRGLAPPEVEDREHAAHLVD